MNRFFIGMFAAALMCAASAGCAGYSWRANAPGGKRTVAVPVFVNNTDVTGLGAAATRQILREIEREGTFKIAAQGESAVEIQGVLEKSSTKTVAYSRSTGSRNREHSLSVVAKVSFIDKIDGRVAVDNRVYRIEVPFLAGDDIATGRRDARSRFAEELARRVVDDVLAVDWEGKEKKENGRKHE
jgi:hypothetical protein